MLRLICILFLLFIMYIHHSTLDATLSSADLSCNVPTELSTSTTILLDSDITINDMCELIVAGPDFGTTATDTVTFTSLTGNKLVISDTGIWNPATFNTPTKQIQFLDSVVLAVNKGGVLVVSGPLEIFGALLALYRGAIVWLNDGIIIDHGTIQAIQTDQ